MKKIFAILAIVSFATTAVAQNITKAGLYYKQGEAVVTEAEPIVVNVTLRVATSHFQPGVYARYAQKYLGKRASLVNRMSYSLVGADVAVLSEPEYFASQSVKETETVITVGDEVAIDRLSTSELAQETAAKSAAERIFELRTARQEIILGEYGDGVYGAGLEAALREIERLEREYLQLFYGVRTVTTKHHRITLPVSADMPNSVVARFNSEEGLLHRDNIAGDIVMVTINPSEMKYPESNIKGTVAYRYANNATVSVSYAQQKLVSRVLPIFEFGETIMYIKPAN